MPFKVIFRLKIIIFFLISILLLVKAKNNLVNLNEENWDQMLDGEWMVEFYAPWCPACKALQPIWDQFSEWSNDLNINVGKVDVTTSPGLSGRFMVTALPTIYHVLKGEFRQYRGGRDKDSLISFIEDKKWQKIEAVPGWKSPGSVQMSVVSWFFKLSTILRTVHNHLLEEYGLPNWGTYLIFALATILVGTLLGLLLVCFIDCVFPPKSISVRPSVDSSLKEEDELGDEGDDLIDEDEVSQGESPVDSQTEGDDDDDDDDEDGEAQNSQEDEDAEIGGDGDKTGESSPSIRKRKARKAD